MTSDMFMSYIKGSVDVLKDHCVFYTKGLNGLGGLSGPATSFACQRPNRLYTIWVRSPFSPLSDPFTVPEGRQG
jgi:hypothetical protein